MFVLRSSALGDPSKVEVTVDIAGELAPFDYVRIDDVGGETWVGHVTQIHDGAQIAVGPSESGILMFRPVEPSNSRNQVAHVLLIWVPDEHVSGTPSPKPSPGATVKKIGATSGHALGIANEILMAARMRRVAEVCSYGAGKFVGFAKDLFADESISGQLRETLHFGCLSEMSDARPFGGSFTRHNYVALQGALLFDAKMGWPGSGLSSETTIKFGKGSALSGLDVCQSWSILLNWGHLFGTFASERALFFLVDQDHALENDILRTIRSNDDQLHRNCQELLASRNLHRLFYVLAAWRVCLQLTGARRRTSIELLNLFLLKVKDPQSRRLDWTFRTTRQLAYNMIHGCMLSGVGTQAPFCQGIADLIPLGPIVLEEYAAEDSPLLRLMAELDAYHAESTFASAEAASLVLAHIRSFKRWWASRRDDANETKLSTLYSKPGDWCPVPSKKLTHFVRLRLLGKHDEWLTEVRAWLKSASDPHVWGESNFIITPSPRRPGLLCDVYVGPDGMTTATATHMASKLAEQSVRSWSTPRPGELERGLWRSSAIFAAKIFEAGLREGLRLQLTPVTASEGHSGYVIVAANFETGRERFKIFLRALGEDPERARELTALVELRENGVLDDVPWLMFLARTRIIDSTGTAVADIDGLWMEFRVEGIRCYVMEAKVLSQPGAAGQLAAKVFPCIAAPISPILEHKTIGQKVAYASFVVEKNLLGHVNTSFQGDADDPRE